MIVDLIGSNEAQGDERRDAEAGRCEEDRPCREFRSDESHEAGRDGGSGSLESLVATRPQGHGASPDEAEADRRNGGPDQSRGEAVEDLGEDEEVEDRRERINEGGASERDDPASDQQLLAGHRVGERATGNKADDGRETADRQEQPDILFRPVEAGKIEGHERAEAGLHVGDEKIRPVESVPAACGDRFAQRPARFPVFRSRLAEPTSQSPLHSCLT
jgi:hypothetical protein